MMNVIKLMCILLISTCINSTVLASGSRDLVNFDINYNGPLLNYSFIESKNKHKNKRIISDSLIIHIMTYEGFSSSPYKDSTGNICIGYGRNISKCKSKISYKNVTKAKAKQWLKEDLINHKEQIAKYAWFNKLTPARKEAVLDLTFNMGIGWVDKFPTAVKALSNGDFDKASKHLIYTDNSYTKKTKYAKQTGSRSMQVAYAIKNDRWK